MSKAKLAVGQKVLARIFPDGWIPATLIEAKDGTSIQYRVQFHDDGSTAWLPWRDVMPYRSNPIAREGEARMSKLDEAMDVLRSTDFFEMLDAAADLKAIADEHEGASKQFLLALLDVVKVAREGEG